LPGATAASLDKMAGPGSSPIETALSEYRSKSDFTRVLIGESGASPDPVKRCNEPRSKPVCLVVNPHQLHLNLVSTLAAGTEVGSG
jgi:hypothetical protein